MQLWCIFFLQKEDAPQSYKIRMIRFVTLWHCNFLVIRIKYGLIYHKKTGYSSAQETERGINQIGSTKVPIWELSFKSIMFATWFLFYKCYQLSVCLTSRWDFIVRPLVYKANIIGEIGNFVPLSFIQCCVMWHYMRGPHEHHCLTYSMLSCTSTVFYR